MRSLGKVLGLSAIAALLACSSTKPCENDTVFLTVDLASAPAAVETIVIGVGVDGAAIKTNQVARRPGSSSETVTIEFSAGYPTGKNVAVDVTALAGGVAVATGSSRFVAATGCTVASVTVGGGALPADGGTQGEDASVGTPDAAAVPTCSAGALRCNDRVVSTCTAAGAWMETEECPFRCDNGACAGECSPTSTRCGATGAQTCSATGTWSAVTACANGCDGAGRACAPPCTAGMTECVGNLLRTCGAAGWGEPAACPFVCKANACGGECAPGTPTCDGKSVKVCSTEGTWGTPTACQYLCTNGACAGDCEPTTKRCNGGSVETCNETGNWVETTKCEFSCAANACAPKQPGKPGVPPTIVSITPADATRVREKNTVTVVFSEEMNTATVEAAWKPAMAGAPKPTFAWSGDKSMVTVDPKFTYPTGSDPLLPRGTYAFTITTDAKDANGESLAAPASRSYPLAFRRIKAQLPFVQRDAANALASGNIATSQTGPGTWAMVGWENTAEGRVDAFMTFFLDPVPETGITIEKATLATQTEVVYGEATGFTNLRIADITFAPPVGPATYDLPFAYIGLGVTASSMFTVGAKASFDVTAAVQADHTARASRMNRTQFRFLVNGTSAKPAERNAIRLLRSSTFVEVVYLIE